MKFRQPIIRLSSSSCTFFLFTTLVIFLTTYVTISTSQGGNESDYMALLSFKSMITQDDPYVALTSWNNSFHFCDWSGVSCGKQHRRVTAIQLESQGLQGSLSPHVGNLSFLRVLSLYNNTFQGNIPHELGHLSRLRVLDLSQNNFSGVIPINLSSCSSLVKLQLGENKLVGSIPKEISFLSKLTFLSFRNNILTGGIPPVLGNLTSLEILDIALTPWGGSIPSTLGRLRSLKYLLCGVCNLSGTIPDSIYNLSLLTKFSLMGNHLFGSLPSEIGAMYPQLTVLQLRENQLSGLLPSSISNLTKLDSLDMSSNNFSGKLKIDFANLRDISVISVFDNNFHENGEFDDMIESMINCSRLYILDVGTCNFRGTVPTLIGNLSHTLNVLYLDGNHFNGNLPLSIGNLVGLTYLALIGNRFTGKIPSTIGMLQNLQAVYMSGNQFSGPIPPSIGNLSLLSTIDFGSNLLEGHIPSSLGKCHNLIEMYLNDNKLMGNIPKELLQLSSLSISLDLSSNNLFGSIPTEVSNLKMLNVLDLSYNNLSGNIPSTLSECAGLSELYLGNNLFQGFIPLSLSSLKGLEELDLSQNNLSGPIPPFFERFLLRLLNLSNNNFEGEVPVRGVFSNASAFSIFGNNRLCGGLVELELPKCKENAEKRKERLPLFVKCILIAFIVFTVMCLVYTWFKKKRKGQESQSSMSKRFLKVSYDQLLKATNGFSEENLIGKGGFSTVYKGILDNDDRFVAVKVLHLHIRGAHKSFIAECEAWRSIRHGNLLKIITSCSSIDFQGNNFKALVYEFMPNGSLHDWLHTNAQTTRLNLLHKINIIIDVATALDYLHNQCFGTVVHGDLKPSNILLDNDMVAHVGDFGLARFIGTNSNQNTSTGVKGTIGYAPPEYGLASVMTSSGDVYSFGILLLEVMTGKMPTYDIFYEGFSLHKFACVALPDNVKEVIEGYSILMQDTEQNAQKMEKCLASILKIGVSCSMHSQLDRMNIENVVHELHHILDALQNLLVD